MLKKSIRACAVLASLVMLLGTSLATLYEFGSKVRTGDTDVNDVLIPNGGLAVGFMDLPPLNALAPDPSDVAYLHKGTFPGIISQGDVRLSPFAGFPAGTRVKTIDPDAGRLINAFPVTANWVYSALFGGVPPQPCVIDDPVYWAVNAASVVHSVTDLRLSKIQNLNPGTWAKYSDGDFNYPIGLLNNALLMIRDLNGNGQYDDSDSVYLKINNASPTEVQPGDLRLTAISGHS
jgi:hypothetical protein